MHTKAELLTLLRAGGIRLSKRLGQHYLVDPNICRKLVGLCELSLDDTVVEIGAGLGALTDLLAARAKRVVAVEVDRAVSESLRRRLAHLANVQTLCRDILEFSWTQYRGSKVVGAIPYHITSPILVSLCEQASDIPMAWLGIQHEVAQRLCAAPGSKAYGRLTVLVQYRFAVSRLARIPRRAFFPQPEVDSAWVRFTPWGAPRVTLRDERFFFEIVKAAFGHRRKTLTNCLEAAGLIRRAEAEALLRALRLPPSVRGEALSIEQFAALAEAMGKK